MVLEVDGRRFGVTGVGRTDTSAIRQAGAVAADSARGLQQFGDEVFRFAEESLKTKRIAEGEADAFAAPIQNDPTTGLPQAPQEYDLNTYYGAAAHNVAQKRYFRSLEQSVLLKTERLAAEFAYDPDEYARRLDIEMKATMEVAPDNVKGIVQDAFRENGLRHIFSISKARFDRDAKNDIAETNADIDSRINTLGQLYSMPEANDPNSQVSKEISAINERIFSEARDLVARHKKTGLIDGGDLEKILRKVDSTEVGSKLRSRLKSIVDAGVSVKGIQGWTRSVTSALRADPENEMWAHLNLTQDDRDALAADIVTLQNDLLRGVSKEEHKKTMAQKYNDAARTGLPVTNTAAAREHGDLVAENQNGSEINYDDEKGREVAVGVYNKYGAIPETLAKWMRAALEGGRDEDGRTDAAMAAISLFDRMHQSRVDGDTILDETLGEKHYRVFKSLQELSRLGSITANDLPLWRERLKGTEVPLSETKERIANENGSTYAAAYQKALNDRIEDGLRKYGALDRAGLFFGMVKSGPPGRLLNDIRAIAENELRYGATMPVAMDIAMERVRKKWGESGYGVDLTGRGTPAVVKHAGNDGVPYIKNWMMFPPEDHYAIPSDGQWVGGQFVRSLTNTKFAFVAEAERQIAEKLGVEKGEYSLGKNAFLTYRRSAPTEGQGPMPIYTVQLRGKGTSEELVSYEIEVDLRDWWLKHVNADRDKRIDEAVKSNTDRGRLEKELEVETNKLKERMNNLGKQMRRE